jgi:hypothetical protein
MRQSVRRLHRWYGRGRSDRYNRSISTAEPDSRRFHAHHCPVGHGNGSPADPHTGAANGNCDRNGNAEPDSNLDTDSESAAWDDHATRSERDPELLAFDQH